MRRLQAAFQERLNRFVARVQLPNGEERLVHVASSGRMAEVLIPGAPAVVELSEAGPERKTAGRLLMVQAGDTWVSVDTSVPGRLFRRAVAEGRLAPFAGYSQIRPEYPYGQSRIDFLLTGEGLPPCLVEVKSVTSVLVDPDGTRVARFPDAPTARGAKHLHELVQARNSGYRTAVCFVVQRADAEAFGPYEEIDPDFGESLRSAARAGVEVYALLAHITPDEVGLGEPLPLRL
ncbi:MAG: DNA/RNA nuclease SfsA [Bacillota bacterium]